MRNALQEGDLPGLVALVSHLFDGHLVKMAARGRKTASRVSGLGSLSWDVPPYTNNLDGFPPKTHCLYPKPNHQPQMLGRLYRMFRIAWTAKNGPSCT